MRNDKWIFVLVIFVIIGLFIRSIFVVALPVTILIILGLSKWWQRHAFDAVIYHRRFHYIRAFPDERFPLKIEIENKKILPLSWLRIQDPWPEIIAPEGEDTLSPSHIQGEGFLTHAFSLRWFQRTQRDYMIHFRKRGVYRVGPAQMSSGDFFGIYETYQEMGSRESITVFPDIVPLERIGLPPEDPFGDQKSRRKLFEDLNRPIGVREYRLEDGFRRVHWPATAKTGDLQVKVFQPTSARVMMMCINVSTYERHWEGVNPVYLEHLLSVAATLAKEGLETGYRVGVISNGCLANSDQPFRIPPGRSPQQMAHLLQALAGVTPVVMGRFDRFLVTEIPRVPYGATLVVITAVIYPALRETLLRIKKHERRIILISIADEQPQIIEGITIAHYPAVDPSYTQTNIQ